ncbi:hypothetical protein D9M68_859920 [compost metagenome]
MCLDRCPGLSYSFIQKILGGIPANGIFPAVHRKRLKPSSLGLQPFQGLACILNNHELAIDMVHWEQLADGSSETYSKASLVRRIFIIMLFRSTGSRQILHIRHRIELAVRFPDFPIRFKRDIL